MNTDIIDLEINISIGQLKCLPHIGERIMVVVGSNEEREYEIRQILYTEHNYIAFVKQVNKECVKLFH